MLWPNSVYPARPDMLHPTIARDERNGCYRPSDF